MSAENGFKETEIGPIPVDWEVVQLGDVASLTMGQSPPSSTYNTDGDGFPFLQGKAEFGETYPTPIKWCSQPKKVADRGSVLISVRAPVGNVNVARDDYCIGRGLAAINGSESLDNWFLFYLLILAKRRLEDRGTGSTFKSINKGVLQNLLIRLPPLPEQCRIAHVLSTIQRAVAAQDDLIAAAREVKRSLMQRLFTYGPGPEPAPTKETEIGPMPHCWEIKQLGEISEVVTGRTPSTKVDRYWNGSIPFITPVDLDGRPIRNAARTITQEGLDVSRPLPQGTVVVSCIGYIGKVGVVDAPVAVTNQQINAIIPERDIAGNWYLAYAMMHLEPVLNNRARVTTVPILNKTNFQKIPVPLPPLDEQRRITLVLRTVDRKIEVEEQRKAALEALFKSMLHQLMTGKLRLAGSASLRQPTDVQKERKE